MKPELPNSGRGRGCVPKAQRALSKPHPITEPPPGPPRSTLHTPPCVVRIEHFWKPLFQRTGSVSAAPTDHIPFVLRSSPRLNSSAHSQCPLALTRWVLKVQLRSSVLLVPSDVPHLPTQPTNVAPSQTADLGLMPPPHRGLPWPPTHPANSPGNALSFYSSLEFYTVCIMLPINRFSCLLSVFPKVPQGQGPCPNHSCFITLALSRVPGI